MPACSSMNVRTARSCWPRSLGTVVFSALTAQYRVRRIRRQPGTRPAASRSAGGSFAQPGFAARGRLRQRCGGRLFVRGELDGRLSSLRPAETAGVARPGLADRVRVPGPEKGVEAASRSAPNRAMPAPRHRPVRPQRARLPTEGCQRAFMDRLFRAPLAKVASTEENRPWSFGGVTIGSMKAQDAATAMAGGTSGGSKGTTGRSMAECPAPSGRGLRPGLAA